MMETGEKAGVMTYLWMSEHRQVDGCQLVQGQQGLLTNHCCIITPMDHSRRWRETGEASEPELFLRHKCSILKCHTPRPLLVLQVCHSNSYKKGF